MKSIKTWLAELTETRQLKKRLERAYSERNVVAIFAAQLANRAGLKAGKAYDDNKHWNPNWRHTVIIDTQEGKQVSWHMSPKEVHLLEYLPDYPGTWDGTFLSRGDDYLCKDMCVVCKKHPAYIDGQCVDCCH